MTMPEAQTITESPFRPDRDSDAAEVRQLRDAGLLRIVVGDVLVAAGVPETAALRAQSTRLLLPERLREGDAVVGFASAVWLLTGWRLVPERPPVSLDLIVSPRRSRAGTAHLRIRQVRLEQGDALVLLGGCLVTTPVRTAADVARDLPEEAAESALSALHAAHRIEPEQVLHQLERMSGARGVPRAAGVVRTWADSTLPG